MAHIGYKQYFNFGFLEYVAGYINNASDICKDTYYLIADIWMLGEYLGNWIWALHVYLFNAQENIHNADVELNRIRNWMHNIIDDNAILELLQWASYEYHMIRNDVLGWLLTRLTQVSIWLYYAARNPVYFVLYNLVYAYNHIDLLLKNPLQWVTNYIVSISADTLLMIYFPLEFVRKFLGLLSNEFIEIIDNSQTWIIKWMGIISQDLLLIISNPLGFILKFLNQIHPEVITLLSNPRGFIYNWLINTFPFALEMLINPTNYIKQTIQNYLNVDNSFWDNPFDYILNSILAILDTSLDTYKEKIKDITIKFILKYI